MLGKFLFLGTGSSTGVPVIGCKCDICHSTSLFNKRLRSSGLVTLGDKTILIDSGPDFRQQALSYEIENIDGLLLTHVHFDHIAGIDDLRVFFFLQKKIIPSFASRETFKELAIRYHYLFEKHEMGITKFDFQILEEEKGIATFLGHKIAFFTYEQNGMKVTGYRLGNFAYVTDIRSYSPDIFSMLEGVDILVISALKGEVSKAHLSLDEAISFGDTIKAKTTWITHISHELEHQKTNQRLPRNVQLAHDGLEVFFEY